MKTILVVILLFTIQFTLGQHLECKDFKEGIFYVESDLNGEEMRYEINRVGNSQEEYYDNNDKLYTKLKWIDDCTYILTFDEELNENMDEVSEKINSMGGIYVEKKYIENECFYFKSICFVDEEHFMRLDGRICKEEI